MRTRGTFLMLTRMFLPVLVEMWGMLISTSGFGISVSTFVISSGSGIGTIVEVSMTSFWW
jgi:hypothetical protein